MDTDKDAGRQARQKVEEEYRNIGIGKAVMRIINEEDVACCQLLEHAKIGGFERLPDERMA